MEILDKRVIYVHVCLYSCLYHTRPVLIRFTQLTPHDTNSRTNTKYHTRLVVIRFTQLTPHNTNSCTNTKYVYNVMCMYIHYLDFTPCFHRI